MTRGPRLLAVLLVAGAATACAAGPGTEAPGTEPSRTLTIMAAASLTEPFGELARRFQQAHSGVEVRTSFDSSATLAAQVLEGAPADVVATADERTMQVMVDADVLRGAPVVFAHNVLALVVPPDNPAGIAELGDLRGTEFVTCAEAVPCGALAAEVLAEADVSTPPRSYEVDVKAVLTKVVLGEADAGFVYASDVVAAGDQVQQVPLPDAITPATAYPIAVTESGAESSLAAEFLDLVRGHAGQQVLREAGFEAGGSP